MGIVTVVLRPMVWSDLPAVARLETVSFSDPWSERVLGEELGLADRRYVVAAGPDESIVGYGGLMLAGEDAHVMTMAVDPVHRRRGLGSRLLLWLVDAATGADALHLTLEVRVSNDAAQGLYRRFGFRPVGVRPGYYGDEDALIMWAIDIDGAEARARLDTIREEIR
jgi:ribosomal-protein-alanine N-acetyltransferase